MSDLPLHIEAQIKCCSAILRLTTAAELLRDMTAMEEESGFAHSCDAHALAHPHYHLQAWSLELEFGAEGTQ